MTSPLPCPFCGFSQGERPPYIVYVMGATWFADCPKCKVTLGNFSEKQDAIAAWNRRADLRLTAVRELLADSEFPLCKRAVEIIDGGVR